MSQLINPASSRQSPNDIIQKKLRQRPGALHISDSLQALKRRPKLAERHRNPGSDRRFELEDLDRGRLRRARLVARHRDVAIDGDLDRALAEVGLAAVVEAGEGEGFGGRAGIGNRHGCGARGEPGAEDGVGLGLGDEDGELDVVLIEVEVGERDAHVDAHGAGASLVGDHGAVIELWGGQ